MNNPLSQDKIYLELAIEKLQNQRKIKNKNKMNIEYVYWSNIKEMISRLRLLWRPKLTGHTGHDKK